MTNRERVRRALEHHEPDRVPYHIDFTVGAREKMAAYYGRADFERGLGCALMALPCEPPDAWHEVEPGIWQDHFGVRWNRTVDRDIGVVCNRVVTPANVNTFRLPNPDSPAIYAGYEAAFAADGERFRVANLGFSLYERAWTLAGMEELLMAMACDKPFANRLLDRLLEYNLRVVERACSHDVDAMMFGDDWGQQRGLIMGAKLWREFIKPRIRQMYALAKSKGKFVFIHSCGKVDELFPDLIECGLDCFNPFQPEVMDVEQMKALHGDRLSFYGGISTQRTLPYGTPAQVRDEVCRLIEVVGRKGGYIAAPAHAIPADARPENIAAMIDVLQSQ